MKRVGVIGAGSWGTALAITLADNGHDVRIFARNKKQVEDLIEDRENRKYLPGIRLPENIRPCADKGEALENADVVLFSTPAQAFSSVLEETMPYITDDMTVINVAKGLEKKTLKRLSEIAAEHGITDKYCVLSGPSHAEEVGKRLLTAIVAVSTDQETAEEVQNMFSTNYLRVYTGNDVIGAELGGALKNIIALGAGVTDGMGFGDNTKAALMTRGIAEMKRLGIAMGGDPMTFSGLTGIGDLIVTCTSMHSRNRRCGILMGKGASPDEAVSQIGMVVEGMYTAEAAYELSKKMGVEMPITAATYKVIRGEVDAKEALKNLMARDLKPED